MLVEIPLNPYQGLKLNILELDGRNFVEVEIPLNPYQGLKQSVTASVKATSKVEIPLNPYQGLKPPLSPVPLEPPSRNSS